MNQDFAQGTAPRTAPLSYAAQDWKALHVECTPTFQVRSSVPEDVFHAPLEMKVPLQSIYLSHVQIQIFLPLRQDGRHMTLLVDTGYF